MSPHMGARPRRALPVSSSITTILVIAGMFALGASALLAQRVQADTGMKFPAPRGTEWEVLAGYNTYTHEDIDPYALDLWRVDGETAGTTVLAPMDGEIGYASDTCVSVRTDEVVAMMCHVYPDASLERGDPVATGQPLGTVAPDGKAGNNGIAHIHFQLNVRNDDTWFDGDSIPFEDEWAIDGVEFEATTEFNAYAGKAITSTNAEGFAPPPSRNSDDESAGVEPSIDAGPDTSAEAGSEVTLTASAPGAKSIIWVQAAGPRIATDIAKGESFTFTAPTTPGTLTFQAVASFEGELLTDMVDVTVLPPAAEPAATNAEGDTEDQQERVETPLGAIVGGQIFQGGISAVVFSGGTTEQLVASIACPLPNLAMWASAPDGRLVQYTVDRPAFVNAAWDALFPEGPAGLTPLLVKCD